MEPHRIDVPNPERFGLKAGAYVLVKPRQSWAALNRVQAAGLVVRTDGAGATGEVTADVLAKGLAVLETAVVSWHGVEDANGRPLPTSRAGYMHDDLDSDFGDWLVDTISAHYAAQRRPAEDTSAEGKAEAPPSPEP